MERLTIIIGGPVCYYLWIGFFKHFEKKFKTGVVRDSHFKFSSNIGKIKVDFFFCLQPKRDKNYLKTKKFIRSIKDLMPPPASEICKKIKKSKLILFFGLCGGFKGKVDDVYLPTEFQELDFKEEIIKHKHIEKLKPRKLIKCQNILINKVKGKKSRVITSNLTIQPKNVEKESMKHVRQIASKLIKHGDAVEKETYQIVKHLGRKYPLGILLVASDVLHKNKYMMKLNKHHFSRTHFNKTCCQAIEEVLKTL